MSDRGSVDSFYKVFLYFAMRALCQAASRTSERLGVPRLEPQALLQVYIGNIDFEVSQKLVEDLVRKYGEVVDVNLKTGVQSNRIMPHTCVSCPRRSDSDITLTKGVCVWRLLRHIQHTFQSRARPCLTQTNLPTDAAVLPASKDLIVCPNFLWSQAQSTAVFQALAASQILTSRDSYPKRRCASTTACP